MQINLSYHAISRYRERVATGLSLEECKQRLLAGAESARVSGFAKGGTRKLSLPDCVLVCKDDGGGQWGALTCYALPPQELDEPSDDDAPEVGRLPPLQDRSVGELLTTEDHRKDVYYRLTQSAADLKETSEEEALRSAEVALSAFVFGEVSHRERLDFYLENPIRRAEIDAIEILMLEGSRASSGRRTQLLSRAQGQVSTWLRAARHNRTNREQRCLRNIAAVAIRFVADPSETNGVELKSAVQELTQMAPHWGGLSKAQ